MRNRLVLAVAASLAFVVAFPGPHLRAQSSPPAPPQSQAPADTATQSKSKTDDQLHLRTDLVSLKVTVYDTYGRVVTGLKQGNFEVYDDKVKQEIAHFTEADAPISIGIIFDTSGSMGGIIQSSQQALRRFIETSHDDDDFFLIAFNNRAELIQDFTTSPDQVLGRLMWVNPKGSTALLDAVYMGVEKVAEGRHERRALLIISDGEDNNSRYSYTELRNRVKEADVQIYAIKIGNPISYGTGILSEIANLTGGRSFIPGTNGMGFMDICIRIALELRHQYSIGFYPTDSRAPIDWHRVQVKLTNAPRGLGRLSLNYKDGYETFRKEPVGRK